MVTFLRDLSAMLINEELTYYISQENLCQAFDWSKINDMWWSNDDEQIVLWSIW